MDKRLAEARSLLEQGDYRAAVSLCEAAVFDTPDKTAALALAAQARALAGDDAMAAHWLYQLTAQAPDTPEGHLALGQCLLRLGRPEEAREPFLRCTGLDPGRLEGWRGLGDVCARLGDDAGAVAAQERILALDPGDASAHYQLTTLVRAGPGDPRVETLRRLLDKPGKYGRERSRLAFALARILDQQGRYDEAMPWFHEANALRHADAGFDRVKEAAWIRAATTTFDRELFARHERSGHDDRRPVLIVGMPRSGSSLLEQVLAAHPDIHGAGETMLLPDTLSGLGEWLGDGARLPEAAAHLPAGAWAQLGERYAGALGALAPQAVRIIDKQLFNYTLLGFARLMLPGIRILHITRHPAATCLSCYMTSFRQDRGFTCSLSDLGHAWRLCRQLMDHWAQCMPGAIFELAYEDLLDDLEGATRRVLAFLELAWSEQCLTFHEAERAVNTASKSQVRQPLYQDSRDHWRHYEPWLGPLFEALDQA